MTYTSQLWPPTTPVRSRRDKRLVVVIGILALILAISGYTVWHVLNPDWRPLPQGAPGALITRHDNSVVITRASNPQRVVAPAAQFVSLAPDGGLLLEDGHVIVNSLTGKQVGYVHTVLPVAGLQLSLWPTSDTVILGSYETSGLYYLHPNDTQAQLLTPDCQLGLYTDEALRPDGKALLCLTNSGTLGIVTIGTSPTLSPITITDAPSGAQLTYATWTHDASRILFVLGYPAGSGSPSHSDIISVRADGSQLTHLVSTPTGQFATMPVLSPDGQSLAYVRLFRQNDSSHTQAFQIRLLGTGTARDVVLASETESAPTNLVWSPDGHYLAYDSVSSDGQNGRVTVVRVSSDTQTQIDTTAMLVGWSR